MAEKNFRGLNTQIRKTRHKIFRSVAEVALTTDLGDNDALKERMLELPYEIVGNTESEYMDIYRRRAIVREMLRLAMGLSLSNQEEHPTSLTKGLSNTNIDEKYYEPPLMQVIPPACNACPENRYEVTNKCQGCLAHPCRLVCPKGAMTMKDGKSYIDQSKCIHCGKCAQVCPYNAISHLVRPCLNACGVKAITSDKFGRAQINPDKCVGCGQCMVSCPFGAIADKSQIFQMIKSLREGSKIIAQIAPAFVGQFGPETTADQLKAALLKLGFDDVYETAIGADLGCVTEAKHYAEEVATGKLPFLLTSCCPSWAMLARIYFPDIVDSISNALTPMVATARVIKKDHPDAKVVFIGPCAAKKLEASRREVRSDVDFVITFEELSAIFDAAGIVPSEMEPAEHLADATSAGRGYAAAGGVAKAIEECVHRYYPDVEVKIEHANSLAQCRTELLLAKAGKKNGCLIEG
ncbi:MAG: 4Fe-4S dicluster domain-containing protein, partial [Lachnospiraceae bacterium]|nr:4Fe-4S dicluster domain-containing protein [Lachnospiraceae bacterium]